MVTRSAATDAWVTRVLGITPGSGAPTPVDFTAALADWQAALETVDGQISTLQNVLRSAPDEELQAIAEFGLNAMTADHKVRVQAALFECRASLDARRANNAIKVIGAFVTHLASDPRIAACDANPFGVKLAVRATLVPPLQSLRAALGAAAG